DRYDLALCDIEAVIRRPDAPAAAYAFRGLCRSVVANADDQAALDGALADIARAPQTEDLQPVMRLARGIVAVTNGDYDQALPDLSWAVDHVFSDGLAHCYRGMALMGKGEFEKAIADFDHAIRNPGEFGVRWAESARGECFRKMGKVDAAISDFTAAIK